MLEERYPAFDGLNLTSEAREGILKHCSLRHAHELELREPGGVGRRFIDRTQPSLEAQVCNLTDEIAYNTHDIDDGVRSGLLAYDQLLASVHAPGTIPPAFVVPYGQYVTPNGRFAMAEPSASTFEIYDLQTDTKVAGWSYANGSFVPTSVAVSPNGMYAAISSEIGRAHV